MERHGAICQIRSHSVCPNIHTHLISYTSCLQHLQLTLSVLHASIGLLSIHPSISQHHSFHLTLEREQPQTRFRVLTCHFSLRYHKKLNTANVSLLQLSFFFISTSLQCVCEAAVPVCRPGCIGCSQWRYRWCMGL